MHGGSALVLTHSGLTQPGHGLLVVYGLFNRSAQHSTAQGIRRSVGQCPTTAGVGSWRSGWTCTIAMHLGGDTACGTGHGQLEGGGGLMGRGHSIMAAGGRACTRRYFAAEIGGGRRPAAAAAGVCSMESPRALSPCVYVATMFGCTRLVAMVASVAMAARRARACRPSMLTLLIATSRRRHSPVCRSMGWRIARGGGACGCAWVWRGSSGRGTHRERRCRSRHGRAAGRSGAGYSRAPAAAPPLRAVAAPRPGRCCRAPGGPQQTRPRQRTRRCCGR